MSFQGGFVLNKVPDQWMCLECTGNSEVILRLKLQWVLVNTRSCLPDEQRQLLYQSESRAHGRSKMRGRGRLPPSTGHGRQRSLVALLPPTGGCTLKPQCLISRAVPSQRSWPWWRNTSPGALLFPRSHHQGAEEAVWAAARPLLSPPGVRRCLMTRGEACGK